MRYIVTGMLLLLLHIFAVKGIDRKPCRNMIVKIKQCQLQIPRVSSCLHTINANSIRLCKELFDNSIEFLFIAPKIIDALLEPKKNVKDPGTCPRDVFDRIKRDIGNGTPDDELQPVTRQELAIHDLFQVYLTLVIVLYTVGGAKAITLYIKSIPPDAFIPVDSLCFSKFIHSLVEFGIDSSDAMRRLRDYRDTLGFTGDDHLLPFLKSKVNKV